MRNRMREVEWNELEKIKKDMSLTWREVQDLLCISSTQLWRYKSCNRLPANRYYAFRDSLLLAIEEKARDERLQVMRLFSGRVLHG